MIKIIRLLILLCISVFLFTITVSAGGDSAGGRPEYTIDQINNGELGDTITFNSISDNPMGHEFNFVDAREDTGINVGKDNVWNANDITVEDGKTYIVRMYVHNNNPNGRDAIAKDVHVAFSIPGDTGTKIQVNGFINSSNATPKEYWDEVNFNSDHAFHLEYVTGSARLSNNGVGNVKQADERNGISIGDDLVYNPNGIKIGYDSVESGEVPGCFEYDNLISVRVKAVFDTPYTLYSNVRKAGTKDEWSTNELEVQAGDELEYQIIYENLSNTEQKNVMLRCKLSDTLKYIPGSTKLWNANYPEGTTNTDDALVEDGMNIGNYAPTANAYVRFRAKVKHNFFKKTYTVINFAQIQVEDDFQSKSTEVTVRKTNLIDSIYIIGTLVSLSFISVILYRKRLKS